MKSQDVFVRHHARAGSQRQGQGHRVVKVKHYSQGQSDIQAIRKPDRQNQYALDNLIWARAP